MKIIDAGLKFNSNHTERTGTPPGVVLHHAAGNGSVEDVHAWHLHNGWAGIGYHFYVRKDGTVYRGRPENWVGAHTVGYNSMIGICAEGNFEEEAMSEAQKQGVIEILAYVLDKYGDLNVYRHRDLDATGCPGRNYPFDEIVAAAKKQIIAEVEEETEEATVTIDLKMLENGSEGEQVKNLQYLLMAKGYDLPEYGADGDFGGETETAVLTFQRDNGLDDDGIVGEQTWGKLLGV